ncbi:hypothetical protein DRQ07_11170 [candidate division KSB1 bacterium]|nr:MAG: hypothetical protein DRQ07_11170 [candidate division KSB1 bacterium]
MADLRAKGIMNKNIISVSKDWTIEKLSQFLDENSITGAPVVDSAGIPVGVVSVTDIARDHSIKRQILPESQPHDFYSSSEDLPGYQEVLSTLRIEPERKILVKDIMTPMIFDVDEDTPVQKIADTMIRGRIHRVFVTKQGKLTGIITALDMLKIIRDL